MNNKTIVILIGGIVILLFVFGIGVFNLEKVEKENKVIPNDATETLDKNIEEDISFNKSKINVYLFWGDGCGHCKALSYFLDNLDEKYKKLFNLYSFETWYNQDNVILMNKFNDILEKNNTGVPYLIIGKDTIVGYTSGMEDDIIKTIIDNYNSNDRYDVYEEIKNNEKK